VRRRAGWMAFGNPVRVACVLPCRRDRRHGKPGGLLHENCRCGKPGGCGVAGNSLPWRHENSRGKKRIYGLVVERRAEGTEKANHRGHREKQTKNKPRRARKKQTTENTEDTEKANHREHGGHREKQTTENTEDTEVGREGRARRAGAA